MGKLALLILAALIFSGCSVCSEKQIAEAKSPDGSFVAALFMSNCGATEPIVFHVNLREARSSFSPDMKGAIDEGGVFYSSRYGQNIKLIWKDEKNLLIECGECPHDHPVTVKRTWKDIKISYQGSQSVK